MWKASWDLFHKETQDNIKPSEIKFEDPKEFFLAKEWNSFHLLGKKLDYLHLNTSRKAGAFPHGKQ